MNKISRHTLPEYSPISEIVKILLKFSTETQTTSTSLSHSPNRTKSYKVVKLVLYFSVIRERFAPILQLKTYELGKKICGEKTTHFRKIINSERQYHNERQFSINTRRKRASNVSLALLNFNTNLTDL